MAFFSSFWLFNPLLSFSHFNGIPCPYPVLDLHSSNIAHNLPLRTKLPITSLHRHVRLGLVVCITCPALLSPAVAPRTGQHVARLIGRLRGTKADERLPGYGEFLLLLAIHFRTRNLSDAVELVRTVAGFELQVSSGEGEAERDVEGRGEQTKESKAWNRGSSRGERVCVSVWERSCILTCLT